ncbi:class IV aminotransferase, partial [Trifolium pratense]
MSGSRYLFSNGILSHTLDVPPVKLFLEAHPGAYTTSRTHNNALCLLFWERHMKRLSESLQILSNLAPQLLFKSNNAASLLPLLPNFPVSQPALQMLVDDSLWKVLPIALKEKVDSVELAITTLVSGNLEELNVCDSGTIREEKMSKVFNVHVHIETYVPPQFGIRGNGAHLAVAGYGRNVAAAKYSDWVRIRKTLEKLRPPSVTELLLSHDGNQILEVRSQDFTRCHGFVSLAFLFCDWDSDDGKVPYDYGNKNYFEVQTAPINDGVLPGIIRQLVL